jgi:hypothetical protein
MLRIFSPEKFDSFCRVLLQTANEGQTPFPLDFLTCRQITAYCTVGVLIALYRCGFSSGLVPLTALPFLPLKK